MDAAPLALLLIEDNRGDAELVAEYLGEPAGDVRLDRADRLAAGLDRLAGRRYDAVLLDLSLPDCFGLDTLRRLAAAARDTPIVVLTGRNEEQLGLEAVREGAQDFVYKGSLTPELLNRVVRYSVERFRGELETRRQEARLRVLTGQMPAIVWTTDRDLRFTSSRGAGLARLDLGADELVGQTVAQYFRKAGPAVAVLRAHARALAGEPASLDVEWRDRLFTAHVEPLRGHRDEIVGTIGAALDVTDSRRAEEEMRAAQRIQRQLTPRAMPVVPGFEVGAVSVPAVEAGGDYVDFLGASPDGVTVAVGDVAGHGFEAALVMASTRASVRAFAHLRTDLADVLTEFNQMSLADSADGRFVTLLLARLDARARTLTYASAGHPTGFVLGPEGGVKRPLTGTGVPLGVTADLGYFAVGPVPLAAGDLILLMTDGVVETECPDGPNPAARQFGYDRARAVARVYRAAPAQQIADGLYHAARAYARLDTQADDISVVVVKVRDRAG